METRFVTTSGKCVKKNEQIVTKLNSASKSICHGVSNNLELKDLEMKYCAQLL